MRPIFPNYSVDSSGNYTYSGTSYTFSTVGGNVVIASNGSVTFPSTVTVNGNLGINGNTFFGQLGKMITIKEGSNSLMGVVSLVGGTATVLNSQITASSRIFLTTQIPGGVPGFVMVSARVNATSFTISSSSATDISTISYLILQGN